MAPDSRPDKSHSFGSSADCAGGVRTDVSSFSQYVVKLPAFMTLSTKGCFCATVKGTFPLAVSTQLYMRMYPSVPPLNTHLMSGVAVTALIDVLCGAAMVGTMSYVTALRASCQGRGDGDVSITVGFGGRDVEGEARLWRRDCEGDSASPSASPSSSSSWLALVLVFCFVVLVVIISLVLGEKQRECAPSIGSSSSKETIPHKNS
ncbi:hypothetical protein KCU91_g4, partial [Aureobasidium melanogenum]